MNGALTPDEVLADLARALLLAVKAAKNGQEIRE